MKCILCGREHPIWQLCQDAGKDDDLSLSLPSLPNSNFEPLLPLYEPLKLDFSLPEPDPIIPLYELPKLDYEPPKYNFEMPKPDPIIPLYEPPKFDFSLPEPDPIIPPYELPKLDYEPPKYNFEMPKSDPIIPLYEPPRFEPLPPPPPPSPVYDIGHNIVGWKSELDNTINMGIGGSGDRLKIEPGGFVRDPLDNLIGQMGPGNTLMPPPLMPDVPDYGPPQSGPEQWDPRVFAD